MLNSLQPFHVSPFPDNWIWFLESSNLFLCKSLFTYLAHSPSTLNEPISGVLWKTGIPSKIKVFACTVSLVRRGTNDLFQTWDLKCHFPWCFVCFKAAETCNRLYLHCEVEWRLWFTLVLTLLVIVGLFSPPSNASFLASAREVRRRRMFNCCGRC